MKRVILTCAAAFMLLSASAAGAQDRGEHQSAQTFSQMIEDDVARGAYTRAQADELEKQIKASLDRVNEQIDRANARIAKANALVAGGSVQELLNGAGSIIDSNGKPKLGGTPAEISQQARLAYQAIDTILQVDVAAIDNMKDGMSEYFLELDKIFTKRNEFIQASPNISSSEKDAMKLKTAKFDDYIKYSFDRMMQAEEYKIETIRDTVQSHRDDIIAMVATGIEEKSKKYGTDPTVWPTSTLPRASTADGSEGAVARGPTTASGGRGTSASTTNGRGTSSTLGATGATGQALDAAVANTRPASAGGTGYASGAGDDDDGGMIVHSKYDPSTGMTTQWGENIPFKEGQPDPNLPRTYRSDDGVPGYNNLIDDGATPSSQTASGGGGAVQSGSGSRVTGDAVGLGQGSYTDGDLNGASFATVYAGYIVRVGDNGSVIVAVPSTQVQTPSSLVTVPSSQVTMPSTQVNVPSTQVNVPSAQINVPTTQVQTPSDVMTSPDLQPALCGR